MFFKMAGKNLMRVKSRTLLTIIAISLGTALITGITVLNESYLESYLNGVSNQLGYTDFGVKIHLNVSDGFFYEDNLVDEMDLEDIDGYESRTGRIVCEHIASDYEGQSEEYAYETTFFGIDVERDKGYGYAEIIDYIDGIEEPESIEDILKENDNYCVITSWIQEVYGFELNDRIHIPHKIDPSTDMDNSSTWEEYTVAGIINDFAEGWDVKYDYSLDKVNSFLYSRAIYVDISQARKMINLTTTEINLLYIHVELNKLNPFGQKLIEKVGKDNEYFGDNIKTGELERVYDSVQSMQMILVIFTIISFLVAIMLTTNTLTMSVSEQKYQIGVLRAQGLYKQEIFKIFLFEALILSILGATLGVVLGLGLSPILKNAFFTSAIADSEFALVLTFNPLSIFTVFIITFSITILVGLLPAYIATKIHIIEAIRNISSEKQGKRYRKLIFPLIGAILAITGYIILATSHRDLIGTMIGIIPFIFGLIIISTVFIPLLSKAFSHIFSFFLGSYRKVTHRNLNRDPKQTKITFIMFGLAIGFLVMVSNVLNSLDRVYYETIPRYLGGDIVLNCEGSTFGMDEVLINDNDIIDGAVEKAALVNEYRIKVDDYGTFYSDRAEEPRINLYIIEGAKFEDTMNEILMLDSDGLENDEVFKKLDDEQNTVIVCKQLLDENHLDKGIGDDLQLNFGEIELDVQIIGITDFVSGVSETWEEPADINPAKTNGKYCVFIAWNSIIPFINDYFDWLPECDILLKGDDHDFDCWDLPWLNRSFVKDAIYQYANENGYNGQITISERLWDENQSAAVADSVFNEANFFGNSKFTHIAFENTSLTGTTEFVEKRHDWYETIHDALTDGIDQCVITKDIRDTLSVAVDDLISVWYINSTGSLARKNATISGIININSTIEAINFHSQNPYIEGNYDVAADDSSAIIFDIETNASNNELLLYVDYFNSTDVLEIWITLTDYFGDHLTFIAGLKEAMGQDYAIADMRWLFTREYSYAPAWVIQINEDDYSQEEALERIKEFLLFNKMPVIGWYTVDEVREQYADQIRFQKSFFNIVLSFALIISVLGIMINMLISISNRRREIGMLRAIGTYKSSLIKMILGETMILVFSGFLIGAVMGIISAQQLIVGLPLDAVFNLRLIIDYWAILRLFLIVILISVVSAALPAYKVLKLDIIEAMRVT